MSVPEEGYYRIVLTELDIYVLTTITVTKPLLVHY